MSQTKWTEVPSLVHRTRLFERYDGAGKLWRVQLPESLVELIRAEAYGDGWRDAVESLRTMRVVP